MPTKYQMHVNETDRCIEMPTPHGLCRFDFEDLPVVSQYTWRPYKSTPRSPSYMRASYKGERGAKTKVVTMHRLVMGLGVGDFQQVDHINRDSLDNRRSNLRLTGHSGNMSNRDSWGAVSFSGISKDRYGYRAQVQANGQIVWRAFHKDPAYLAVVRDAWARTFHGEYATLNYGDDNKIPPEYLSAYKAALIDATAKRTGG